MENVPLLLTSVVPEELGAAQLGGGGLFVRGTLAWIT